MIDEEKRLRRLGIDPDGDPVEIMREVERKCAELRRADPDEPITPDEPVVVDSPNEPR